MSEKELILQQLSTLKLNLRRIIISHHWLFLVHLQEMRRLKKSDVDVLVDFSHIPDLLTFLELEEKLKSALGKNVDLVPNEN